MPRTNKPHKSIDEERTTSTVSKIKLWDTDHKLAVALQHEANSLFRKLTIQELLREAIHIGLPAVASKYRAALNAAQEEQNK